MLKVTGLVQGMTVTGRDQDRNPEVTGPAPQSRGDRTARLSAAPLAISMT